MATSGIRDRNLRSSSDFLKNPLQFNLAAVAQNQTAVETEAIIMPYAGVVTSIKFYAVAATSTNAIRAEFRKNGTTLNIQSATTVIGTDGGGAQTAVSATAALLTTGPGYVGGLPAFAAGDRISLYITTGASDTLTQMTATVVVRPLTGSLERTQGGLQD
jgi:hypothetical protein